MAINESEIRAIREKAVDLLNTIKAIFPELNTRGRPKCDMPVKNIYDALQASINVGQAAAKLGVSRGYIYSKVPEPRKYLKRG